MKRLDSRLRGNDDLGQMRRNAKVSNSPGCDKQKTEMQVEGFPTYRGLTNISFAILLSMANSE